MTETTRLGAAWARVALATAAQADGAEAEAAWRAFYAAFAVQPVVLALADAPDPGGALRPMILDLADGPVALAFEDEAGMAAFIDRPTERLVLPGADLARALGGLGLRLALDPGGEGMLLEPAQLDWIATHFGAEVAEETAAPAALGVPRGAEPALLAALGQRLAEMGAAVAEAWLAALGPDLVLVMCPRVADAGLGAEMARDLTRIGQMATDRRFGVALASSGAPILAAARRVGIGLGAAPPPG